MESRNFSLERLGVGAVAVEEAGAAAAEGEGGGAGRGELGEVGRAQSGQGGEGEEVVGGEVGGGGRGEGEAAEGGVRGARGEEGGYLGEEAGGRLGTHDGEVCVVRREERGREVEWREDKWKGVRIPSASQAQHSTTVRLRRMRRRSQVSMCFMVHWINISGLNRGSAVDSDRWGFPML